jgi:hypothetical protein
MTDPQKDRFLLFLLFAIPLVALAHTYVGAT